MRADAQNLQALTRAINTHNLRCAFPATGLAMNPFEADRLGWDQIMGLPIIADGNLGTGMFRVLCDRDQAPTEEVETTIVDSLGREPVAA